MRSNFVGLDAEQHAAACPHHTQIIRIGAPADCLSVALTVVPLVLLEVISGVSGKRFF